MHRIAPSVIISNIYGAKIKTLCHNNNITAIHLLNINKVIVSHGFVTNLRI